MEWSARQTSIKARSLVGQEKSKTAKTCACNEAHNILVSLSPNLAMGCVHCQGIPGKPLGKLLCGAGIGTYDTYIAQK